MYAFANTGGRRHGIATRSKKNTIFKLLFKTFVRYVIASTFNYEQRELNALAQPTSNTKYKRRQFVILHLLFLESFSILNTYIAHWNSKGQ